MQISKRRPRLDTRLLVGLFAAGIGAIWLSAGVKADDDGNVVRTDKGTVRGIETPSMHAFLGIPYAAAPVGNLRWQPPRPHAPWNEPLDASSFGDHCPQPPSLTSRPSVTEDCLFLNVFTPRRGHGRDGGGHGGEGHDGDDRDGWGDWHDGRDERSRPVMLWISGGGLTTGESDDYDPVRFVNEGAIVVTINYRLGILGFFAHPALSAESPDRVSGNYGLLDQQFALRWVRRNIASFGGDPDNVTIFGLSAGALSVHAQLASPGATGLFRRAIVQSGAYSLGQPTLADAQALGAVVAGQAGCATAACLRALPVTTILALQDTAFPNGMLPVVDGKTLPQSIGAAFGSGLFNRVPVIEGSTHDEGRFFVGTAELATGTPLAVAAYIPAIAQALGVSLAQAAGIATFYPLAAYSSPSLALGTVTTDAIFACNARLASGLLSQHVRTYQYEFNDPQAPIPAGISLSFPSGAYHSADVQYLFELPLLGLPGLSSDQTQLSSDMVRYWTRFARTGTPNAPDVPAWPRYGASDRFQSLEAPTSQTRGGFAADHKCALWTPSVGDALPGS
jgi:para-nitrobenzyl esterase